MRYFKGRMLLVVVYLLALACVCVSCSIKTPKESDFSFTYDISTEAISVNADIVITATLSNLSEFRYKLEYSSYLIGIFIKGDEGAYLDILFNETTIKAGESIIATKTVSFEEPGEYDYIAVAIFTVKGNYFAYRIPFTITVSN